MFGRPVLLCLKKGQTKEGEQKGHTLNSGAAARPNEGGLIGRVGLGVGIHPCWFLTSSHDVITAQGGSVSTCPPILLAPSLSSTMTIMYIIQTTSNGLGNLSFFLIPSMNMDCHSDSFFCMLKPFEVIHYQPSDILHLDKSSIKAIH